MFRLKQKNKDFDFYKTFWISRNPLPASDTNVRLIEHYKRMIFAEKNYEYDRFRTWFNNPDKQGYLDFTKTYELNNEFNDKGLIFIRHGKANDWAATVGKDIPHNESWLYYETENTPKMTFHFLLENSAGYWRFSPTLSHFDMISDRISWGSIYHRLLTSDRLERLALQDEMAKESKIAVSNGLSTDRHTWEKEIKPLPIPFSSATFRGENGNTILEVYYSIFLAPLLKKLNSQSREINVEKGISLHDPSWNLINKKNDQTIIMADKNAFYTSLYRFEIEPDSYNVAFYARPESSDYLGGWKTNIPVDNYVVNKLAISDIQMAGLISDTRAGSLFNKRNLLVVPNPSKTYLRNRPVYIYFEIYKLKKDAMGKTIFSIDYTIRFLKGEKSKLKNFFGIFKGGGKSSIRTSIDREGNDELSVEYLAIDVSKVKKGAHELEIKITDKISGETAIKKGELILK